MIKPNEFVPLVPLKSTIIFPGLTQVIKVGREKSIKALHAAEKSGFWVIAVQQKVNTSTANVEISHLYDVGTLCRIESMKGTDEHGYQIILKSFSKMHLDQVNYSDKGYLEAQVSTIEDSSQMNALTKIELLENLKVLSVEILKLIPANTSQLIELINSVDDLSYLTSLCAGNIDIDIKEKQKILEMKNLEESVLYLVNLMKNLKEHLTVQAEIRNKMNQKMGESHRQNILREQLNAIKEELGDSQSGDAQEKLKEKIDASDLPEEVRKVAEQEFKRLSDLGPQSPESGMIRNYLDLIVALPWKKSSEDKDVRLDDARATLDKDHFGLERVKKRIIQHLAVLKIKKDVRGSILLFVGPPGVGKTSLGESIAKVLGKKFVRVSLGGVRDDAEVRGHRRTYIGAMPGRIIQSLKKAGENNPVFLLDEIDKLSRGYGGDPAAALLEVLDPEQNADFMDHYLDLGFDLSKVFFIATANSLEGIPGPLLDRMEVIDLTGYTVAEKLHIAKNHLIPKLLTEFGIKNDQLEFSDEVLLNLISNYTREAGVRELKQKIGSVIRTMSENIVNSPDKTLKVTHVELEDALGPQRFQSEIAESFSTPGVVTGLAWTPVGGDILFIESTSMPGKGDLIITGQLGDVMKESARIALSLIRSNLSQIGLNVDLSRTDLHVHVPAGAIPKDGPSAGVTMLTSLASLLTGKKVSPSLAMTGEITLRGAVMPVGGIKEKVIAAHRAGIKEIIMSQKNKKDLAEIPDNIKESLKFHFIDNVTELFKAALDIDLKDRWTVPAPGAATPIQNNSGAAN